MNHGDHMDLALVDDPINQAIVPDEQLSELLGRTFRNDSAAVRELTQ